MVEGFENIRGGCTCGQVRYEVLSGPMIVHCCHCRICQNQTGSAFAVNALIEANRVILKEGKIGVLTEKTPSGMGQTIARCKNCHVAVWSNYHMGGLKERIRFIRVGTLDNPNLMPPDIHIYTTTKQPWVVLPSGAKIAKTFYQYKDIWSDDALKRRAVLFKEAGIVPP